MVTMVIGGARSGKSAFGEQLAGEWQQATAYLATAVPFDEEMEKRIERHRTQRPACWTTVEWQNGFFFWKERPGLQEQLNGFSCLFLDSLGMLINNWIFETQAETISSLNTDKSIFQSAFAGQNEQEQEKRILSDLEAFIDWCRNNEKNLIMVTEEVGMGLVPETPVTRRYRDVLGAVNRKAAALSDRVYLVVAGLCVPLKQEKGQTL